MYSDRFSRTKCVQITRDSQHDQNIQAEGKPFLLISTENLNHGGHFIRSCQLALTKFCSVYGSTLLHQQLVCRKELQPKNISTIAYCLVVGIINSLVFFQYLSILNFSFINFLYILLNNKLLKMKKGEYITFSKKMKIKNNNNNIIMQDF